MLRINRKAYTRADGTHVSASSFLVADRGAKGRTPKSKRFFHPKVHTGWKKTQSAEYRRRLVLEAHKGDILATARAMQSLSNVSVDLRTKLLAGQDARYFFGRLK